MRDEKKIVPLEAEELSAFAKRIHMMLKAGIPVSDGLAMMSEERAEERALLVFLQGEMEKGNAFSQALEASGAFPAYFTRLVSIGEESGRTEQVMASLAAHYDREAALASGVRRAVVYPAAMALILLAVLFVVLTQVLPLFETVYNQLGSALPPTAAGLISFGKWAQGGGVVLGALFGLLVLAGLWLLYTRRGRAAAGGWMEKWFSGGKLGDALFQARFSSAMALMLASGIPPSEGAPRAGELTGGDQRAREKVERLTQKMEQGGSFAAAAEEAGLYSGLDAGLLSAGFLTGNGEDAMEDIAARSAEEADRRIDARIGRIEPVMVAVLSLIVGLVLLSVMLPLIGVLGAIG